MQLNSSTTYKLYSQPACYVPLPDRAPDRNGPGLPTVSFDNSLPAVRPRILELLNRERGTQDEGRSVLFSLHGGNTRKRRDYHWHEPPGLSLCLRPGEMGPSPR